MKKILLGLAILGSMAFADNAIASMQGIRADMNKYRSIMSGQAYVGETALAEQILTEINQRHLMNVQPPMRINWSLERDNINRRTKLWNDKNKISYIYLLQRGAVVGFYSIKGKVSSVNSTVTNPNMVYEGTTLDSPAEDGSYGTNGDAVFFFTSDGSYVEWNGEYLLTDRPMKLNVQPLMEN